MVCQLNLLEVDGDLMNNEMWNKRDCLIGKFKIMLCSIVTIQRTIHTPSATLPPLFLEGI